MNVSRNLMVILPKEYFLIVSEYNKNLQNKRYNRRRLQALDYYRNREPRMVQNLLNR